MPLQLDHYLDMGVASRKHPRIHTDYQLRECERNTCPRIAHTPFLCVSVADISGSGIVIMISSSNMLRWCVHIRFLRIIVWSSLDQINTTWSITNQLPAILSDYRLWCKHEVSDDDYGNTLSYECGWLPFLIIYKPYIYIVIIFPWENCIRGTQLGCSYDKRVTTTKVTANLYDKTLYR